MIPPRYDYCIFYEYTVRGVKPFPSFPECTFYSPSGAGDPHILDAPNSMERMETFYSLLKYACLPIFIIYYEE